MTDKKTNPGTNRSDRAALASTALLAAVADTVRHDAPRLGVCTPDDDDHFVVTERVAAEAALLAATTVPVPVTAQALRARSLKLARQCGTKRSLARWARTIGRTDTAKRDELLADAMAASSEYLGLLATTIVEL